VIRAALVSEDPPEYVLLLNADTIVRDGAIEALVSFMDAHPRVGIGGSQLLSAEGRIEASPYRFFNLATELDRGLRFGVVSRLFSRWAVVMETPRVACRVDWVSGASMILRRSMLDEIGLLDEGLFTYFDDVDICLRARSAGWETWYIPESRVVHLEGASTGLNGRVRNRLPPYLFQARRRFFLKHHGSAYTAAADALFLAGFALWRLRRRVQRKPDLDPEDMLADAFHHSVFRAGFKLTEVENPATCAAGGTLRPQ
jgi:GT2 family glycosyltransferase